MTGTAAGVPRWTDGWAAPALLAAATAAVFARSLGGGFVWDDHVSVTGNPSVSASGEWLRPLTDGGASDPFGFVRPLRTLDFKLDHALFGAGPLAYHVHSLLWHAAAAVLLLLVLRRLLGDGRAALVAATFWAVHPAQVEPVAWISCRGDVAMGACVLASILFALRSNGLDRNLAASLAFAAAAPLYKETAVALWIVVAVLRWRRLSRAPVWPYVAVAAAYFVYRGRVAVAPFGHVTSYILGGSVPGTFATMTRGFGFYVAETFLPAQSLDWYLSPSTSFADGAVVAWCAVHAALVATAIAVRRRAAVVTVAVAWFYAFLLPVANWPVLLDAPTAERYLYLPLGGAALVLGWAMCRSRSVTTPAVVIVAALTAQSVSRQPMWRSDDALWDSVRADHDSPRAYDHFAKELRSRALRADPSRSRKLLEESLDNAHRAIDLWCALEGTDHERNKRARDAELTASNVCHRLGRDEEALFHANEAIRIDESADELGHYDRALALLAVHYPSEADAAMRRALEIRPARAGAETEAFFLRAAAMAVWTGHSERAPFEAMETACPVRRRPPAAK